MAFAFEKFEGIDKLDNVVEKQQAWMEDYKGLRYSKATQGTHWIKWKTETKKYHMFDPEINCIGRKKNRLIIEFDDKKENGDKDKEKILKNLEDIRKKFKDMGWGYIESTHFGNSNYIWCEFNRDLTTKEAEAFLKWIAPTGSEIDLNFTSDEKVYPILFATHWKHSYQREMPICYFKGQQIDFDSLGIKVEKKKSFGGVYNRKDKDFYYRTFIKGEGYQNDDKGDNENREDNTLNILEEVPLKRIEVIPGTEVTTKVLIADISPGISLTKCYIAKCPECKKEKVVHGKGKRTCRVLFAEKDEEGDIKEGSYCMTEKGKDIIVDFESVTDTGFLCGAFDPEDTGASPQFTPVFFSNKIIPTERMKREEFEIDIQTKPIKIYGEILIMPSAGKKVVDWLLDIKGYKFEEREAKVDKELLFKFKDEEKDDDFFKEKFCPKVYGNILAKKIHAIALFSPNRVKLKDGGIMFTNQNVIIAGDPGQSKTQLFVETLNYCKELRNAKLISVENSTQRGLIGGVVKNVATGQYMIKVGQILLCNEGYIGLDGIGKFTQEDNAQMRGLQEERMVQINKMGGIKKEVVVRNVNIANLTNYVRTYYSKHQASFDIAATTQEKSGKFSGADRRRFSHIKIMADEDISHYDIDLHFIRYNPAAEKELIAYWNNLREFAWSRKPDDFIWEEGVFEDAIEKVNSLKEKYKAFSLDYGILSKGGIKHFISQLPATAILHNSIKVEGNDVGKVIITKNHINWLYELYLQEFRDLGLDLENDKELLLEEHAKKILEQASAKFLEVIKLIFRYGSQTAAEKAGYVSRMTIWRTFNEVIPYTILETTGIDAHGNESCEAREFYYCPNQGSGKARMGAGNRWIFEEPDGFIPSLFKQDGTLTYFGRIMFRKLNDKANGRN